jgi:hypothetical protein
MKLSKLVLMASLQIVILVPYLAQASVNDDANRSKVNASARKAKAKKLAVKAAFEGPRDNLSRDIRFGDSSVYGKYQLANEGTAEVENEKTLDDLLGVRTNFKDRLRLETKRH